MGFEHIALHIDARLTGDVSLVYTRFKEKSYRKEKQLFYDFIDDCLFCKL